MISNFIFRIVFCPSAFAALVLAPLCPGDAAEDTAAPAGYRAQAAVKSQNRAPVQAPERAGRSSGPATLIAAPQQDKMLHDQARRAAAQHIDQEIKKDKGLFKTGDDRRAEEIRVLKFLQILSTVNTYPTEKDGEVYCIVHAEFMDTRTNQPVELDFRIPAYRTGPGAAWQIRSASGYHCVHKIARVEQCRYNSRGECVPRETI